MNSLDSRFLHFGDTFAQKFSRAGQYRYDFNLPVLHRVDGDSGQFIINVKETARKNDGQQHFVVVRQHKSKQLTADPPELTIEAGDVVLWSAADASIPGFSISGHSDSESFNSAALMHEALYTHAFGSPGRIEWEDANGNGLSGKIVVRMPNTKSPKDLDTYKESLLEGTLVVISGEKVEPAHVEISVGQTVFFAVEKAAGISITDRALNFEMPRDHYASAN